MMAATGRSAAGAGPPRRRCARPIPAFSQNIMRARAWPLLPLAVVYMVSRAPRAGAFLPPSALAARCTRAHARGGLLGGSARPQCVCVHACARLSLTHSLSLACSVFCSFALSLDRFLSRALALARSRSLSLLPSLLPSLPPSLPPSPSLPLPPRLPVCAPPQHVQRAAMLRTTGMSMCASEDAGEGRGEAAQATKPKPGAQKAKKKAAQNPSIIREQKVLAARALQVSALAPCRGGRLSTGACLHARARTRRPHW
jgi:hypothetical protein